MIDLNIIKKRNLYKRFLLLYFMIIFSLSIFFTINNEEIQAKEYNSSVTFTHYFTTNNHSSIINDVYEKDILYNNKNIMIEEYNNSNQIVYLTFDDGPTFNTLKVLEILKKENVKATFFILGKLAKANPDIITKIKKEGHSIGNHTYSHDYNSVYLNEQSFLKEVNDTNKILKDILGENYETKIFRFPGGSFNKEEKYKISITNNGFKYIDWNASNGDGSGHNIPKDELIENVKNTISENEHEVILLMHDSSTKNTTVDALHDIIEILKNKGYTFKPLSENPKKK